MDALRRLAQPPASVPVLDRRRAHLLAWLLLVMILLAFTGLIFELVVNPSGSPRRGVYFWLILLLLAQFGIAFALLRAGYYRYSAALTILCAVCVPWGFLIADPSIVEDDFVSFTYILISILLSSILLHPLFTSILAGLQLIALMWIASISPVSSMYNWPSLLALIVVTSVLCILFNIVSQRDLERIEQQTRQLELDAARQNKILEEAQKRIKQMTVLHQVATAATQLGNIDRLIGSMTEIIGKNLFPDNCGVFLLDEQQDLLRPHPSYHSTFDRPLVLQEIPLGKGITGQVAQTGQTIRIGSIAGIPNYVDIDQGTSSELCVPIKHQNKILGVINVESTRPEAFSMDDEQLLGTLAGQLATAIEQLRATDAEHRWLGQLAHSNELIRALSNIAVHLQKAFNQEEIIQMLGNDLKTMGLSCAVAVSNRERGSFIMQYTSMPGEFIEQLESHTGSPFLGYYFSLDLLSPKENEDEIIKPVVIMNTENPVHLFFPMWPERVHSGNGPGWKVDNETIHLRLPLLFEETLLGIFWVWSTFLTEADLSIMFNFAQQVASALKRAQLFQEIQSLALTDPLTGLQNRRSLFELGKIEFARSQRMDRHFCCLMLDLDHFKTINDQYGHPVGDLVLQEFAQDCKRSVRAADLIGRYGGEELVIFLPETDLDTAVQIAERLRETIEKMPIKYGDQELHVTVSIGVSRMDENTLELETLIARADQALYIAKYKGRNQVAIST